MKIDIPKIVWLIYSLFLLSSVIYLVLIIIGVWLKIGEQLKICIVWVTIELSALKLFESFAEWISILYDRNCTFNETLEFNFNDKRISSDGPWLIITGLDSQNSAHYVF